MLSWMHFGDLHVAQAGAPNHQDLRRLVARMNRLPSGSLDFAVLPGDNADDGTVEQFRLIREAIEPLRLPLHILPGDHDFKPGSLENFNSVLGVAKLPYAITVQGHRCLFLDVVSAGTGGPDFRLDQGQLAWVTREVEAAEGGAGTVIFMHTYPADLREGGRALRALLERPEVLCVDMGHTHYNELANDGGTIFMATRSIGQVEEGAPGFSIAAVDDGCVSWRFKTIEHAFPAVLITQPADRRLATGAGPGLRDPLLVRAKIVGDVPTETVELCAGDGPWRAMDAMPGDGTLWQARCEPGDREIRVRARDAHGRVDEDRIERRRVTPPIRAADGSDRDRVGAWPEKAILGTQLGPNRNGRAW